MSDMAQTHELKTDVAGLIRLLAKNLYAQPDVFIREMIQNAHDSIVRRREIELRNAPSGLIYLRVNRNQDAPCIIFEDNGAGLTEQEIHDYLSTIGRSGTDAFRKDLQDKGRYAEANNLIGQFGIGLLSAFVVANHVLVETRSCRPQSVGWRWECWGDRHYQLSRSDAVTRIGSRVTLYIDAQHRDMLDLSTIRQAVRKYADFLELPIHLNDEGRINSVDAPWHHAYSNDSDRLEDYTAFVKQRFPDTPLAVIPVDCTEPYPVKGVLYISNTHRGDLAAPGRVDIYQSRMFIVAQHPDMLPGWAKFVNGVIDSSALTPTAARDNIQHDSVAREIRDTLGRVVIHYLKDMAQTDPERFQEIMDWHHFHVKGMALEAQDFFLEVADLLPFETNEGRISLRDYLRQSVRNRYGQQTIVYFHERGQATQFFMLANAKGLKIINASYAYEEQFLKKYAHEFPDIHLEKLDFTASELIFQSLSAEESAQYRELLKEFNRHLLDGSQARIVRFKPVNIPAVITLSEAQSVRRQLDSLKDNPVLSSEIRELLGHMHERQKTIPIVLYLNANNPTIEALSGLNVQTEVAVNAMKAIYSNALMLAQHLITPQNAELMFAQFNQVINLLIAQTQELNSLRQSMARPTLAPQHAPAEQPVTAEAAHTRCYLLCDAERRDTLMPVLSTIVQDRPYYWELLCEEAISEPPTQLPALTEAMRGAQCFIVDCSSLSAHSLLMLGMLLALNRPTLLLRAKDAPEQSALAMLADTAYEIYDSSADFASRVQHMVEILQQQHSFQQLIGQQRTRFLSVQLLQEAGVSDGIIATVCEQYSSVEAFLSQSPEQLAEQLGLRVAILRALQEHLREH